MNEKGEILIPKEIIREYGFKEKKFVKLKSTKEGILVISKTKQL